MWLFTRYGFFSVSSLDKDTLLIRARARKHLQALKKSFIVLDLYPILVEPKRDYRYRMQVPREVWATVVLKMTMETTWGNVKAECSRFSKDPIYKYSMELVWHEMFRSGLEWEREEEECAALVPVTTKIQK